MQHKLTRSKTDFHQQNISGTLTYVTEVMAAVEPLHLKYGVITRSDPLRLVDPVHLLCMYLLPMTSPKKLALNCPVGSWWSAATARQVPRSSQ